MANVLYDKTPRLPKEDSLRRAVLLSVWLRRQEMKVRETKVLAMGLAGILGKDMSGMTKSFKEFVESAFPFTVTARTEQDQKMVEMMQKEAQKGAIIFDTIKGDPLRSAAKRIRLSDDFKKNAQKYAVRGKVL